MAAFKEGSYFYCVEKDDGGEEFYTVFRCLKLDEEYNVAHVTLFESLGEKPAANDVARLQVAMEHAPIDLDGFDKPVVFADAPLKKDDLDGYYTYLKMTDFHAYIDETGADVEAMAADAERLFNEATEHADKNEFAQAADLYYQAYEAFPLYYEAVENAGLCHLDLEDYESAMHCFEESIEINGNNFMTDYSIGECHLGLGDKKLARQWFHQALNLPDITDEQKEIAETALKELLS